VRIYEIIDSQLAQRAQAAAADTQAALEWAWGEDRQLGREIALGRFGLASRAGASQERHALINRLLSDLGEDPRVVDLVCEHAHMFDPDHADDRGTAGGLVPLFPQLTDLYARQLCAQNISIRLTWDRRFGDALEWSDRAIALGGEISPLAEAGAIVVKADTLLEAGRADEAERTLVASDAIAGPSHSRDREVAEFVWAQLASLRGAHAEALERYGRALTYAELVGDVNTINMVAVNLVRTLRRAGRERAMLELAGIVDAIAAEQPVHDSFFDRAPDIGETLARLGPEGDMIIAAGRALDPTARVKRICSLLYAHEHAS
jgi:tetratricopeptide (TPR) repeat protein